MMTGKEKEKYIWLLRIKSKWYKYNQTKSKSVYGKLLPGIKVLNFSFHFQLNFNSKFVFSSYYLIFSMNNLSDWESGREREREMKIDWITIEIVKIK